MHDDRIVTIAQLEAFMRGASSLAFVSTRRAEKYAWTEKLLERFFYFTLRKRDKVTVRNFIMKVTGYSEAQVTRLIRKKKKTKSLRASSRKHRSSFPVIYTTSDIARLIETDNAHGRLSGPATKKLFIRAFDLFHDERFVRLKNISVAHIYNLRGRRQYASQAITYTKTRPTTVPIRERRKPFPQGKPGYIRVDSVHQGDLDKEKGVYHINLVDEVTQWEIVGCVEGISEYFLVPLIEALLAQFPFRVIEFHSDNGSEYINYVVAKLLKRLTIEQTKSRPRRSNDNALVEGKNGSVIRKHMGYSHIARHHAKTINDFYQNHFNTYVNFHRPSGYATEKMDHRGKIQRIYDTYETPYEHFKGLTDATFFLKPGSSFADLDVIAAATSDLDCATMMQKTKHLLFKTFRQ